MAKQRKSTAPKVETMENTTTDQTVDQETTAAQDTEVEQTTSEVTEEQAQEAAPAPAPVVQAVVEKQPEPVAPAYPINTPEQMYNHLTANGTDLEKGTLETVHNFISKNGGPQPYGISQAVQSQFGLLNAILNMLAKQPTSDIRKLWVSIIYLVSLNNKPSAAFGDNSSMIGTQYWAWGKDKYSIYQLFIILMGHMADPARSKDLKSYISRKAIDSAPMTQEQRNNLNHILQMYGV